MMEQPKIQRCLILEWTKLPADIKKKIAEWESFHNDCLLEPHSEFNGRELTKANLTDYWQEQSKNGEWSCKATTLEEFILEYNLWFEDYIIKQDFDLTDVDKILIDVSW